MITEVKQMNLAGRFHDWLKHFWEEPFFRAEVERAKITAKDSSPKEEENKI
jgi:hypothetical protein